jgi:hypothetical protein
MPNVKREAVARARASDKPLQEIAEDLGVETEDLRRWLEEDRRRDARQDVVVKTLLSTAAAALLLYRLHRPNAPIDGVTLGLLAVVALPWLSRVLESANFFGASIKFRELKATQQRQGADIATLNFMIRRLITEPEILHLEKLAANQPFPLNRDATTPFLMQELRHLRQVGFIDVTGEPGHGARALERDGGDVKDHFVVTPEGKEYLAYLHNARG